MPPFTDERRQLRETINRWSARERSPRRRVGGSRRVPGRAPPRAASWASSGSSTRPSSAARAATTSTTRSGPRSRRRRGLGRGRRGLGAHTGIATPPCSASGRPEQHERFLRPAIRGERIAALGITEPGAGSDVASIRTHARPVDGGYVVNGAKTESPSDGSALSPRRWPRSTAPRRSPASLRVCCWARRWCSDRLTSFPPRPRRIARPFVSAAWSRRSCFRWLRAVGFTAPCPS